MVLLLGKVVLGGITGGASLEEQAELPFMASTSVGTPTKTAELNVFVSPRSFV